jgi:hypothetical protein
MHTHPLAAHAHLRTLPTKCDLGKLHPGLHHENSTHSVDQQALPWLQKVIRHALASVKHNIASHKLGIFVDAVAAAPVRYDKIVSRQMVQNSFKYAGWLHEDGTAGCDWIKCANTKRLAENEEPTQARQDWIKERLPTGLVAMNKFGEIRERDAREDDPDDQWAAIAGASLDALGFDVDENPDGTLVPFNPNPDPRRALHRRRFILLGGEVRLAEYDKREAADREAMARDKEATEQKVKTRLGITETIAAAVRGTCVALSVTLCHGARSGALRHHLVMLRTYACVNEPTCHPATTHLRACTHTNQIPWAARRRRT